MRTIEWHNGTVQTIDQTRLPTKEVILTLTSPGQIAHAIRTMKIRGAPLLGAAAAFALALTAYNSKAKTKKALIRQLENTAETVRATRPTAVNLFWALDRILKQARENPGNVEQVASLIVREANSIADEDVSNNRLIGEHGATLINDGDGVLTHCNAGALATVDYGTALGVLRTAWHRGKRFRVYADETRPLLQGARLTAYELMHEGIPVTLITDGAAGYAMRTRKVNMVIVGADRIIRDAVINKIGTYTLAVLAKENHVPFYVAAPKSTFDLERASADVTIEQRSPEEVTRMGSRKIAPDGVDVLNPAFDVTPLRLVSAVICETGVLLANELKKLRANRYK